MDELQHVTEKLLRRQDVESLTGLGRTAIFERLNPKSQYYDPTFPRAINLGGANSVRWVESEVLAWVHAKIKVGRRAA